LTLKEVFDQGACKVGNLIILEGGQHFLIGDATPFHAPSTNDGSFGWDGWFEKKVLYVFDLLDGQSCAILEQFKQRAALTQESADGSISQAKE
jgi:hypothetical protein